MIEILENSWIHILRVLIFLIPFFSKGQVKNKPA